MAEEEEEEDWQSPPSQSLSSPSLSSSSHTLSPIRTTTPHHRHHDLFIFPPINHEGLPIPPPPPRPPRAPLSLSSSNSDSQPPSPSPKPPSSHLAKWVDFTVHMWNSKLQSFLAHVRSIGLVSSIRLVGISVPFLVVLWFWVCRLRWRRRRGCGGQENESVEQLKLLIKEKDEFLAFGLLHQTPRKRGPMLGGVILVAAVVDCTVRRLGYLPLPPNLIPARTQSHTHTHSLSLPPKSLKEGGGGGRTLLCYQGDSPW